MKDKQSGDVYAMKTLKKSQTLSQESVSWIVSTGGYLLNQYILQEKQ